MPFEVSPLRRRLLPLALLLSAGCDNARYSWPQVVTPSPRYADLLPFRAAHLTPRTDPRLLLPEGLVQEATWIELDPVGRRDALLASLARMKKLGARQVIVPAPYAYTTEPATDKVYDGFAVANVIYRDGEGMPGGYGSCQRGDMGLAPAHIPAAWAGDPAARARAALGGVLDLVRGQGLVPVLSLRPQAIPAHPRECLPCDINDDCAADSPFESVCMRDAPDDARGICHVRATATVPFLDPSRDQTPGFSVFFAALRAHVTEMTALAGQHGAKLVVLGGGAPYLTGAGEGAFAHNNSIAGQRPALLAGWRATIAAARAVPGAPLLTYAAQDVFLEGGKRPQPLPEWQTVDFWRDLDVVGIDFFQPAREGGPASNPSTAELTVVDMIRYQDATGIGQTRVDQGALFGNLRDLARFAQANGSSLAERPVLLITDGVPASRYGAAQPYAYAQGDPLPRPGEPVDFEEQRRALQARLTLIGEGYQAGWLGGVGLWAVPANVVNNLPTYGGVTKSLTMGVDRGFTLTLDYYGVFETPAEGVVRDFWCPVGGGCP